ncbi:uncharacterized protein EMH_0032130 [Eimeria mitis]|uniref:Uncharacterized protein n=1 Tax=Eimeria mitis TaxID=44415 RepID=U6KDI4_9EIME|nr:uncharacterized protein EMH_0032130 [Eimeria mitis]CDJ36085.1 hypothetical protein, conserved [Eimeria mitis]
MQSAVVSSSRIIADVLPDIICITQGEDATRTAQYWDLVHARGRVAYFISTRSLQKVLKPIVKLGSADAAAQVLLEDAHIAALRAHEPCGELKQQQQQRQRQPQRRHVARPPIPLSHTLLELMCGSRPTHLRLLQNGAVTAYVGIDVSQRALHLAREACRRQLSAGEPPNSGASFAGAAQESAARASAAGPLAKTAACVHEVLGSCTLLRHDCRMLSEELPLLQSRFILLVAGLDDIIARSTTDNTDARGPCDEALLQVLHSAAFALPVGGTLLLLEPMKHFPELLLSLYKALQHPVLCCRLLLCEAAELVGPSRDVFLLRLRRHTDASECMRALEKFHATDVARLATRKPFRRGLQGALEAPQAVQHAMPLCYRLSLVQQAKELSFLLCQVQDIEGATMSEEQELEPNMDKSRYQVNCSGNSNTTTVSPLHAAVAAGNPQLVDLLIRHGAQPTGGLFEDPLSVAADMLLQEAVTAGLSLPEDLNCTGSSSTGVRPSAATGVACAKQQSLLRSIILLSWVEGQMSALMGGPICGCCCCKKDDFLQTAAGVPPVSSLIWPIGDPLEAFSGGHPQDFTEAAVH